MRKYFEIGLVFIVFLSMIFPLNAYTADKVWCVVRDSGKVISCTNRKGNCENSASKNDYHSCVFMPKNFTNTKK